MSDLYSLLGVDRLASGDEIKRAYRKAALQHHPDKGGDADMFKNIQKANEVLSNPESRAFYDQTGQIPGENGGGGPGGPGGFGGFGGMPFGFGGPGGGININMNDIFGNMFGGNRGPPKPEVRQKPEPKIVEIPLSLYDFYHGKKIVWNLHQRRFCKKCNGNKFMNTMPCNTCKGTGNVTIVQQLGPMIIQNTQPCGDCQGKGKKFKDSCDECQGSGQYSIHKEIVVEIKPGMKPGDNLVFPGESSVVEGYLEPGDIIGRLQEAEDVHKWERQGYDLWNTCTLSLSESLLGCKKEIGGFPKDNGVFVVEIPVGVQNKSIIAIHGEGLPCSNDTGIKGHCFINIIVKPTTAELQLLKDQGIILQSIFQSTLNNNVQASEHATVYKATCVE